MSKQIHHCLLLEDDPEDQEIFVKTVHEVTDTLACYAVSNGMDALEVLAEGNFVPDIIFTDINMPEMDGLEFLKRIKSSVEFGSIPVIVYTGSFTPQTVDEARKYGATAIYAKSPKALKQILIKYCQEYLILPNANSEAPHW